MGWEMVYIQCHEQKKYVINGKQFLYATSRYLFGREKLIWIYIFWEKNFDL